MMSSKLTICFDLSAPNNVCEETNTRSSKIVSPCMATDPSFVAGREDKDPLKDPIGVLATPTMHTSVREAEKW